MRELADPFTFSREDVSRKGKIAASAERKHVGSLSNILRHVFVYQPAPSLEISNVRDSRFLRGKTSTLPTIHLRQTVIPKEERFTIIDRLSRPVVGLKVNNKIERGMQQVQGIVKCSSDR